MSEIDDQKNDEVVPTLLLCSKVQKKSKENSKKATS